MACVARYWRMGEDGRIVCELCPRFCALREGQRGMCFVRMREGDRLILDTYGRSSGFCIDPIEKKPLNHFLPGTPVLSFGTAGCNLACKFCQNHEMSKSRDTDLLAQEASPALIASCAREAGCRSVAYTYNDPVIFLEYAVDIAGECRKRDVKNVAVTAGYMTDPVRPEFFQAMDAANIDLKGFTERFYRKLTGAEMAPVLDSIAYAVNETDCWVELTVLLIPGENDSATEIREMSRWVVETCGPDVPMHFTTFRPDHRMMDREIHACGDASAGAERGAGGRSAPCLCRQCPSRGGAIELLYGLRGTGDRARLARDLGLAAGRDRAMPGLRHPDAGRVRWPARRLGPQTKAGAADRDRACIGGKGFVIRLGLENRGDLRQIKAAAP